MGIGCVLPLVDPCHGFGQVAVQEPCRLLLVSGQQVPVAVEVLVTFPNRFQNRAPEPSRKTSRNEKGPVSRAFL
jgi:hypothetical protein